MIIKRIIKINNKGVAPALTLLLVIPVILTIVTAISFWAENIVINMDDSQDKIHEFRDGVESIDFADLINRTRTVFHDDFEDAETNNPQWTIKPTNTNFYVGPGTPAEESYYSGHLSGYINILGVTNCEISKIFSDKCYGNVSIEAAFTADSNENSKVLNISQNDDEYNKASIKIEQIFSNAYNIYYLDNTGNYQPFIGNVYLHPDPLCWHTMKLIVNFDSDSSNSYSLNYVNFTLDGITYDLSNYDLNNIDESVSDNPETLQVSYNVYSNGGSESWVDDFLIINLEPHKQIKCINWV